VGEGSVSASRTTRAVVDRDDAAAALAAEHCSSPRAWSNGAGDTYGRHAHDAHKVLFCLEGSIVFHTPGRDVELSEGDRLDLDPGTEHAATVGPDGCSCLEGMR
jgi:mannose-6-phosphate isomerase-like protein (cupin superfamily)